MTGAAAGSADAQAHMAAAGGLQIAYAHREGGKRVQRIAELVERQRLHMELDVGALARRIGTREQAKLRRRHGERATPAQRIVEPHTGAADQRMIGFVERLDAGHLVDQPELQVILQVLADAGLIEDHRQPEARNLRRRPDAREQQQLR